MNEHMDETGYFEARQRARLDAHRRLLESLMQEGEAVASIGTVRLVARPVAALTEVEEPASLAS